MAFLSYFPVPLTRNVRVHASVLSAYFAGTRDYLVSNSLRTGNYAMLKSLAKLLTIYLSSGVDVAFGSNAKKTLY